MAKRVSDDAAAVAAATLTQAMVLGRRLARGDRAVPPPNAQTIADLYKEFVHMVQEADDDTPYVPVTSESD